MLKRERITILVEVDTDPVPGWGNDPEDYVKHVQKCLDQTIPHYNPVAKLSQPHENVTNHLDEPEDFQHQVAELPYRSEKE